MADQKLLEKIRKLLALARDPSNEHEAALAAAKARELLAEHNLTLKDVEIGSIPSGERRVDMGGRVERWIRVLARATVKLLDAVSSLCAAGVAASRSRSAAFLRTWRRPRSPSVISRRLCSGSQGGAGVMVSASPSAMGWKAGPGAAG
jgi:hypothetical protein